MLRKIRKASNKYTVPEDGCDTYRQAYKMLEELQNDLHQHVHLENNILLNQLFNQCVLTVHTLQLL
ncbi:MAG TPA: hypothetical protein DDX29_00930 [Clostridiales bacterium]|nr:hypothetical protein [Clostridiales bacterium]